MDRTSQPTITKCRILPFLLMLSLFALFINSGCVSDKHSAPDVSDIIVETKIVRFDSLLYSIQTAEDLKKIQSAYPQFYELYFYRILGLPNNDSLFVKISEMLRAETFSELKTKISNHYARFDDVAKDWSQALKYYQYYFHPTTVPDLYTNVTEFAYGSFIFPLSADKDGIGVSLDLFLGDRVNYTLMSKLDPSFSAYSSRTFNRDHLIKKAIDALIEDKLPPARGQEFIHHLLREGKKYYISDHLLPFASDTVIWEYTGDQWTWVQDNEWNIYSYLITNELFYSKARANYLRLISPAPHTKDMPPEAPGRVASYIGYKIIEAYMRRYPETTYTELIDMDANALFQAAKYKPVRE